jgi:RNA ligase
VEGIMTLGELLDVDELRDLIQRRYVAVTMHPTLPLAIINYTNQCMFDNFWPETVQLCRGLIINAVNEHDLRGECLVVARPFRKFFNLNHPDQADYAEANLPTTVTPTVTEKMDGWFGILWTMTDKDQVFHAGIASRGSFTSPGALFGTDKLRKFIKYGAIHEFPAGYSPIFEIIFKEGKIVVDYPFEGLVLLGLVNNETGEEMPYEELRNVWAKIASYAKDDRPWIRLVHAHDMSLSECVNYEHLVRPGVTRTSNTGSIKNQEGFVITYPRPGTYPIKVKVKFEEYKRLHKLITGVTPQQIWASVHDPMVPWLGGDVPDHFRKWAVKWRDELYERFHTTMIDVLALINSLPVPYVIDDDHKLRKDWHEMLIARDPKLANIAMEFMYGKHYLAHQAIWKQVRPVGREEVFYREGQGESDGDVREGQLTHVSE